MNPEKTQLTEGTMMVEKRKIYQCDKVTMKIIAEYDTISEAAKATGLCHETVAKSCKLKRAGLQPFLFRFADEYDPNERFGHKAQARPVLMLDLNTREIKIYGKVAEAAKDLFLSADTIYSAIRKNSTVCKQYRFKYVR